MSLRFEIVGWAFESGETVCKICAVSFRHTKLRLFPVFADDETVACSECGDVFGSVEEAHDLEVFNGSL